MAEVILNTGAKLINGGSGIVVDAVDVGGGYFKSTTLETTTTGEPGKIPDYALVEGALCFCTGTAENPINRFYRYTGTEWVDAIQVEGLAQKPDSLVLLAGGKADSSLTTAILKDEPGRRMKIKDVYPASSSLPDPNVLNDLSYACLVGTTAPYDLYIQVTGNDNEVTWKNTGAFNAASRITVGGVYQSDWNADIKADRIDLEALETNATKGLGEYSIQQFPRLDKLVSEDVNGNPCFSFSADNASGVGGAMTYGAVGKNSAAFCGRSSAQGRHSMAVNSNTVAQGAESLATGYNTITIGDTSFAGGSNTAAIGKMSHATGEKTKASGYCSTSKGGLTIAEGDYSVAEGYNSQAIGESSHAENGGTKAIGNNSHAGGVNSNARGYASFAHGVGVNAVGDYSFAIGIYNDGNSDNIFEIGNGEPDPDDPSIIHPRNVFSVTRDGRAKVWNSWISEDNDVVAKASMDRALNSLAGEVATALQQMSTDTETNIESMYNNALVYTDEQISTAETYTDTKVAHIEADLKTYIDNKAVDTSSLEGYVNERVNAKVPDAVADQIHKIIFENNATAMYAGSGTHSSRQLVASAYGESSLACGVGVTRPEAAYSVALGSGVTGEFHTLAANENTQALEYASTAFGGHTRAHGGYQLVCGYNNIGRTTTYFEIGNGRSWAPVAEKFLKLEGDAKPTYEEAVQSGDYFYSPDGGESFALFNSTVITEAEFDAFEIYKFVVPGSNAFEVYHDGTVGIRYNDKLYSLQKLLEKLNLFTDDALIEAATV